MPEFDFENPITDPVQLEKDMIETMLDKGAIGLSANQVGIQTRVFVMGHRQFKEHAQAFFNPIIVGVTDDLLEDEEGCLSFPSIYVKIKRPRGVLVRFQNSKGETQEAEFFGYECRCFLHEFDHLEGITYKDRLSTLKWALAVKKATKRKYK
jgi:peptide deformylase